ncbi:MAG TPA: TRAP transporter small permease subunit [Rhodospirillales bacterium]|nr:TRAP transporter small permease subunit [Rhodospirillales bacterium]
MRALERFALVVDWINERVGRAAAWLTLAMVLITFTVVILRYVFSTGFVWLQEAYVWLHGVVFMLGAGYTLLHDGHVRVDIFYREASLRRKAMVDLLGSLLLLLPFVLMVVWVSWPYALVSWQRLEGSREAGGLPGLFLLKSVIVAFCILLGLQALAMAARAILALGGHAWPRGPENGVGEV